MAEKKHILYSIMCKLKGNGRREGIEINREGNVVTIQNYR